MTRYRMLLGCAPPLRGRLGRAAVAAWGGGLLAGLLAVGAPMRLPVAQASIGACTSDPVAVLSNGVAVDLRATIDDSASDVRIVAYSLHAPAGTTLVSWTPTTGPLGPKETVQFSADNPPDTYTSGTVITTGTPHIAVTATTQAAGSGGAASGSDAGWDRQLLRVWIVPGG